MAAEAWTTQLSPWKELFPRPVFTSPISVMWETVGSWLLWVSLQSAVSAAPLLTQRRAFPG